MRSVAPVVVIGAGPIGLAAAAHLVERGIDVQVFEAGDDAAASVRQWGHTRLFSPWRHLIDPASALRDKRVRLTLRGRLLADAVVRALTE